MKDSTAANVDEYFAALPGDQRAALRRVRATIRAAAPEAVESISYGMPAFRYQGRPLIYFGAARNHCAPYGNMEPYKDDLEGHYTSKGTLRFTSSRLLPAALVEQIVKVRMQEIEGGAGGYAKRSNKKSKGVTR